MAAIGRTVSIMKTLEVRFLAQSTRCLPVSINIVDPVLLGEPPVSQQKCDQQITKVSTNQY